MQSYSLKHGEVKTIEFTYTQSGTALTITGASITAIFKDTDSSTSAALTISDGSINKVSNTAYFTLDTSSLTANTDYYLEVKTELSAASIDKSETFFMRILKPIDE
jgi:hypothetical protein